MLPAAQVSVGLDAISRYVYQYLRPLGWRKFCRLYNRRLPNNFVQILHLDLLEDDQACEVNLGLYAPEFALLLDKMPLDPIFQEPDEGLFQASLGKLIGQEWETWRERQYFSNRYSFWHLNDDPRLISEEIIDAIQLYAEPYFRARESYESIWQTWQLCGDDMRFDDAEAVRDFVAAIANSDYHSEANAILRQAYRHHAASGKSRDILMIEDLARRLECSL